METGRQLHLFGSFIVGMLLLVSLVLLCTRGYTNANSAPGVDFANNNNVVTGTMAAAGDIASGIMANANRNFATVVRSTGNTSGTIARASGRTAKITGLFIIRAPRPIVRATTGFVLFNIRSNLAAALSTAHFAGNVTEISATFVGRNLVGGAMLTAASASHTVNFLADAVTIIPLTKPADKLPVPVIQPLEATAITLQTVNKTNQAAAAQPAAPPAPAATPAPLPAVATNSVTSLANAKANDLYAWGNCTYWVYIRRFQIGDTIPNSWGNATSWAYNARADGYVVDHSPTPGSIMQISGVDFGLGHVAFVESVDPDGTWHISEMNVEGLDVVDNKAEPASAAANYYFIHDN